MKLSRQITIILPALLFTLPAFAHSTGTVHDHGINYLLLLAALVTGMAAMRSN